MITRGLEEVREEQHEREAAITKRRSSKATIDPALVQQRQATIDREQALRGRSLRKPPITR